MFRYLVILAVLLCGCEEPVHADVSVPSFGSVAESPAIPDFEIDAAPPEEEELPPDEELPQEETLTEAEMNRRGMLLSAYQIAQQSRVARQRRHFRRHGTFRVSRTQVWSIPDDETGPEAEATGLLRICGSEIEWATVEECGALLQTIRNIRASHCDHERVSSITECSDGRETLLSAMRRASRYVMGMMAARSSRQRWMRQVTLDCDEPEAFPSSRRTWPRRRCEQIAAFARETLIDGVRPRQSIPGARPIAWGGRCERTCTNPRDPSTCTNVGACDDPIACRRRLARIPGTEGFLNAFWCRPGTRGCPRGIDPVCRQFLFGAPDSLFVTAGEEDADDATDGSRESDLPSPEGVLGGDAADRGPVVLDLHESGVSGDRVRPPG